MHGMLNALTMYIEYVVKVRDKTYEEPCRTPYCMRVRAMPYFGLHLPVQRRRIVTGHSQLLQSKWYLPKDSSCTRDIAIVT
jgi:hypothetical protein